VDARIAVALAALLFSTGGTAIKLASLSSAQIAGLRSCIAALALALLLPAWRPRGDRRALALGLAYASTLVLFVVANRLTTAANAIFLQMTAPLYVLLLGPRLLGEPTRRGDWFRVAAIGLGMLLFFLAADSASATAPDPWRGNLCAAASGLTWALTLLGLRAAAARPAAPGSDPAGQAVVMGNLITCVACAPLALPLRASALDWLLLAYLGMFQIGVAYLCLTRGMRRLRAFEVSLLLALEPVSSTLLAWAVHGERPAAGALAGSALILVASLSQSLRDAAPSTA
jgi:DME family drug/metabolite transporter